MQNYFDVLTLETPPVDLHSILFNDIFEASMPKKNSSFVGFFVLFWTLPSSCIKKE
jgi:hypothetical protein